MALYLTNEQLPVFLPLGFVGLYRWFWFFLKLIAYFLYKPLKPRNHPRYKANRDVTILVPTIDNGEEIKIALESWLKSDPYEIIFITIPEKKQALEELARSCDPEAQKVRVITIKKGNKRNQMTAGVNNAKTPLIIFCDDDVIWPETMIEHIIAPFEDKKVGGVGTSQTVLPLGKRFTIWEILAAYRISMRNIEITASTYIDGGVVCLSGRTAAYRTAILRDPEFQWQFTHEYWLGKYHQHSGDDKFLTRWMHNHEWKTWIQSCPEVMLSSTFKDNWRFLKQLLRWTRNTWRSDFRSLFTERIIWRRYPFVAFTMLDKMFNPITLLAGPITVIYLTTRTKILPPWVIIISYIVWLLLSRLIKYLPHFMKRPQDVLALPVWIVFNIYFALMKVYCLFTLHITDWGTRAGADGNNNQSEDMDIYVVKEEIIDRSRGSSKSSRKGHHGGSSHHSSAKNPVQAPPVPLPSQSEEYRKHQSDRRPVDLEKGTMGPMMSILRRPKPRKQAAAPSGREMQERSGENTSDAHGTEKARMIAPPMSPPAGAKSPGGGLLLKPMTPGKASGSSQGGKTPSQRVDGASLASAKTPVSPPGQMQLPSLKAATKPLPEVPRNGGSEHCD